MEMTSLEETVYEALEDVDQLEVKELMEDGYTLFEALEELGLLK